MNEFSAKVAQFNSKGNVKAYMSEASSVAKSCVEKKSKSKRGFEPLNTKVLVAYIMGVVLAPAVISATAAGYGAVVAGVACGAAVIYGAKRLVEKMSNKQSLLMSNLKNNSR